MSHHKLQLLIFLVVLGFALQYSGAIDPLRLIIVAREYADHWWLMILLVAIQTIMFTFAAPGSSIVWVSAALYPPVISVSIIASGTVIGGITAYLFSVHLSSEWTHKVEKSRIYRLLRKESGFLTLFALRVMPGFPHSAINYSSGILKVRFITFIPASAAGSAIKAYVYSKSIYSAIGSDGLMRSIDFATVWPLLVLSLSIIIAMLVKHHMDL